MPLFRPFCGIRPAEQYASSVAALPYDVYDSAEARSVVQANPLSFLRVDRAETLLPEGTDSASPQVYRKARETLDEMLRSEILIQDSSPCFYVYSLTWNGHTQTGLVGCASVDDYCSGLIRRHENTLEAKEQDRICHVNACSAHTGPIFLACRPQEKLRRLLTEIASGSPLYDFTCEDGVRHQVWKTDTKAQIDAITTLVSAIPSFYIADGHHRAASAVKAGLERRKSDPFYSGTEEYNYFLSVLFPSDELTILDYNRVITDKNGYTTAEFLDKIKDRFTADCVRMPYHPRQKGEFGLYCDKTWYRIRAKDSSCSDNPVDQLDVSLLQSCILAPVLGIQNPKTDPRIHFVGGIRGLHTLERMADSTDGIAFTMYPTSMDELLAVADAGMLMPPKSTWFEPKLRSGLFIHRF